MNRITSDGRLPFERCSVCKWEPYASSYCTCPPSNLLRRGDITEDEAYVMIGVQPPDPGGFVLPFGARRQRGAWVRLLNATRTWRYRRRCGHACKHVDVTSWQMYDLNARQTRWCRTCGCTEYR